MSQENVDVVTRLYEAWQRDGFGVVAELMDPTIEWVNPPDAIEPGTRTGLDAFASAASSFTSVFPDPSVTAVKIYDAGERIAVRATMSSRSVGSEVPISAERGYLFDVRDGKVVRFAWFNDPAEALAAVGVTE
jgi:ketosteroid isomerase-like protein